MIIQNPLAAVNKTSLHRRNRTPKSKHRHHVTNNNKSVQYVHPGEDHGANWSFQADSGVYMHMIPPLLQNFHDLSLVNPSGDKMFKETPQTAEYSMTNKYRKTNTNFEKQTKKNDYGTNTDFDCKSIPSDVEVPPSRSLSRIKVDYPPNRSRRNTPEGPLKSILKRRPDTPRAGLLRDQFYMEDTCKSDVVTRVKTPLKSILKRTSAYASHTTHAFQEATYVVNGYPVTIDPRGDSFKAKNPQQNVGHCYNSNANIYSWQNSFRNASHSNCVSTTFQQSYNVGEYDNVNKYVSPQAVSEQENKRTSLKSDSITRMYPSAYIHVANLLYHTIGNNLETDKFHEEQQRRKSEYSVSVVSNSYSAMCIVPENEGKLDYKNKDYVKILSKSSEFFSRKNLIENKKPMLNQKTSAVFTSRENTPPMLNSNSDLSNLSEVASDQSLSDDVVEELPDEINEQEISDSESNVGMEELNKDQVNDPINSVQINNTSENIVELLRESCNLKENILDQETSKDKGRKNIFYKDYLRTYFNLEKELSTCCHIQEKYELEKKRILSDFLKEYELYIELQKKFFDLQKSFKLSVDLGYIRKKLLVSDNS